MVKLYVEYVIILKHKPISRYKHNEIVKQYQLITKKLHTGKYGTNILNAKHNTTYQRDTHPTWDEVKSDVIHYHLTNNPDDFLIAQIKCNVIDCDGERKTGEECGYCAIHCYCDFYSLYQKPDEESK